jgi:hypothetical protein
MVDADMKFRIIKRSWDGTFVVQRKGWFGWRSALYEDDVACSFSTYEKALDMYKRIYEPGPDEVVTRW